MIVINVVIGGFSGEDLAHVNVQIQVSYCSQLSDYTVRLQRLEKNTALYAPITFEEIDVVMINTKT